MNPLEVIKAFVGKPFEASPSPFMRWLNPIVLVAEEAHLEFQYKVRSEWLNPIGNLHGGVTATIVDDMLGATMFCGKQFINAECEIWNADKSRLIARGISNLFKTEIKRSIK